MGMDLIKAYQSSLADNSHEARQNRGNLQTMSSPLDNLGTLASKIGETVVLIEKQKMSMKPKSTSKKK